MAILRCRSTVTHIMTHTTIQAAFYSGLLQFYCCGGIIQSLSLIHKYNHENVCHDLYAIEETHCWEVVRAASLNATFPPQDIVLHLQTKHTTPWHFHVPRTKQNKMPCVLYPRESFKAQQLKNVASSEFVSYENKNKSVLLSTSILWSTYPFCLDSAIT